MKKWIFIVIGILIVGFIGYKLIGPKSNNRQMALSQARTATVQKGNFQVNVSGTGTVEPVTSEDIQSTVSNNSIAEVLVNTGDSVKSGDPIITFTDGSAPITAPADGVITSISVSPGEGVRPGQVVAHLTNYTNLETVNQIDELDIPKVQVGQTATISVNAFPNKTFTGKVTSISNEGTSTNGTSTFNVTLSINNPQDLKVGMSDQANILTASKNNVLYIPLEAVHTSGNQDYVILASGNNNQNGQNGQGSGQGGFGQRQMITTGLANDNDVEVTSGLTEGQVVRLPNLVLSTTQSNSRGMGGFGSYGGFGGGGGSGFGGGGGNRGGGSGK